MQFLPFRLQSISQRPTSTKTRIKTKYPVLFATKVANLRDQLPRKQGLRQV